MKAFTCLLATAVMTIVSSPSSSAFQLKSGSIISSAHSISYVESQGKNFDSPATLFIHGLDSSCEFDCFSILIILTIPESNPSGWGIVEYCLFAAQLFKGL